MRVNKWSLATLFAAVALIPSAMQAQTSTPNPCLASGASNDCSITKDAQATLGQVLILRVSNNAVSLNGPAGTADSTLYAKTFVASGNTVGTPGADLSSNATSLQDASMGDTVQVMANRAFQVTLQAQNDVFDFTPDGTLNLCRPGVSSTCGTPAVATAKSVGDVFVKTTGIVGSPTAGAASWAQLAKSSGTAQKIADFTSGGLFTGVVNYRSAWYYATDIPGAYTVTMVYTITGK